MTTLQVYRHYLDLTPAAIRRASQHARTLLASGEQTGLYGLAYDQDGRPVPEDAPGESLRDSVAMRIDVWRD